MGGRGVYVGGDNTQIKMEAYVAKREIERVRIEWEIEREKTGVKRGDEMANRTVGTSGASG